MTDFWLSIQHRLNGRDRIRLLRPLMIAGVLLGSFYLGRKGNVRTMALLIIVGMALIFMRYPMTALIALVVASFLVPLELGTGTLSSINITMLLVMLLLVLWVADMLVMQKRVWLYGSRVIPPLLVFSLVAVLAFLAGQLPWFSFAQQVSIPAQLGGLSMFLLSAGAFLWVGQHLTDIKWLKITVWLFIALGAVFILFHFSTLKIYKAGNVATVPFFSKGSGGSLFWTWLVALSASQALLNRKLKMGWRILLGLVCLMTLVEGWRNRQWASGLLPGVVALLVVLLMMEWRVGVFVGALMVLGVLVFNPAFTDPAFTADQYSAFTRTEAWKILLGDIWRVSPLLGLGPSNYYNYTPLFNIMGYYVQFNSHNQYVDIVAQTGILGLAAFAWLAFEIGWLAWRLKDRAAPGFNYAYVIGALAGLGGTLAAGMLADWLIPFVYNINLRGFRSSVFAWIFLGGLVAIERLTEAPERSGAQQAAPGGEIQAG